MLQQVNKSCPEFTGVWLIVINVFYLIFGIVLIATSTWGINAQQDDPILAALPAGGLVTLVVVGVFLMVVSVIGIAGAVYNSKIGGRYILGIYATFLVCIMIMEFAAAGVLLAFTGALDSFGPGTETVNGPAFRLINQSYEACCCARVPCPNGTCWIPSYVPYPCDSLDKFSQAVSDFISQHIEPVGAIAIFLGLMQLMTAIVACVNQCKGQKAEEMHKIGGSLSYDGQYEGDGDEAAYGYAQYVKTGQAGARRPPSGMPAPGSTAPAAAAPKAGATGRAPAGTRAPTAAARK